MTDERWQRLQDLFAAAVELPEAARERFLQEECHNDPALLARLRDLLRAERENTAADDSLLARASDPDRALIGQGIDHWRLLRRIGDGGMGSVFLAERIDGDFEQRVALKIVKKGMDSDSVVRRFRLERQILARLEHPNIARVLDGGMTADGRPYFVMEYVDGLPITDYCDRHQLTIDARLRLFQLACDAVHAAHRRLVVHRDLKPSNIMVTADGELKLLDFGIAKLLDESQDPHLTRTGLQVHTPAYAAPEQLLDQPITTATDVYALGVILYELLSGRRPFETRRTPQELAELVVSGSPQKPSLAITELLADTDGAAESRTAADVSARRGLRVERLQKSLRGDLDTICLMALHREPDHRYASADQVSDDIERHLTGQPVIARPDALSYRIGKFYRRNRAAVLIGAALTATLLATASFYTLQLARERDFALNEQRKANEVVQFVTGLFEVADPHESRGEKVSARRLLDEGARQIRHRLVDRPEVQLAMQSVLGQVYYSLGVHETAHELLEDTLARQRSLLGDDSLDVATTKLSLGLIYQDRGDPQTADRLYREALETRVRLLGDADPAVIEALSVRAFLEETIAEFATAETLYRQALALCESLYDGDHAMTAKATANLAGLLRITDRADEAEVLLRDALAMQERIYGGPHPDSDSTKRQLAGLLRDSNRLEESRQLYLEVIASRTAMLGDAHMEVAHTYNSYSQLLQELGETDAAIAANRHFIDIMERIYNGPHPSLGAAYNNLAVILRDQGDYAAAIDNYQRSLDMLDAVGTDEQHPNRSFPMTGMADVFIREGRFDEALPLLEVSLRLREAAYTDEHRLVAEARISLGQAMLGLDRLDEAESLLLRAHTQLLASRGPDDGRTRRAARALTELYTRRGDTATADRYRESTD